jgi:hypothetical protein
MCNELVVNGYIFLLLESMYKEAEINISLCITSHCPQL